MDGGLWFFLEDCPETKDRCHLGKAAICISPSEIPPNPQGPRTLRWYPLEMYQSTTSVLPEKKGSAQDQSRQVGFSKMRAGWTDEYSHNEPRFLN